MANMRLIVDNAWDNAILSADQEAMPITNTQGRKGVLREYPWRSTDTTAQAVGGVFPQADIEGIVISRANFTQAATVTAVLKLSTATVDTIVMVPNGTDTWVAWIAPTTADEIEITIDDTANPAEYLQFVQCFAGPKVEVNYNYDLGMKFTKLQDVEHIRTAGQSLRSQGTGLTHKNAKLNFSYIPEVDRLIFVDAMEWRGQSWPFFVSLLPNTGGRLETDHQFVAKLVSDVSYDLSSQNFWSTPTIEFAEA